MGLPRRALVGWVELAKPILSQTPQEIVVGYASLTHGIMAQIPREAEIHGAAASDSASGGIVGGRNTESDHD